MIINLGLVAVIVLSTIFLINSLAVQARTSRTSKRLFNSSSAFDNAVKNKRFKKQSLAGGFSPVNEVCNMITWSK